MNLIIAGGRDFTNKDLMIDTLNMLVETDQLPQDLTLICGMAKGADNTGLEVFKAAKRGAHIIVKLIVRSP